jgi:hypothetical protein
MPSNGFTAATAAAATCGCHTACGKVAFCMSGQSCPVYLLCYLNLCTLAFTLLAVLFEAAAAARLIGFTCRMLVPE